MTEIQSERDYWIFAMTQILNMWSFKLLKSVIIIMPTWQQPSNRISQFWPHPSSQISKIRIPIPDFAFQLYQLKVSIENINSRTYIKFLEMLILRNLNSYGTYAFIPQISSVSKHFITIERWNNCFVHVKLIRINRTRILATSWLKPCLI